MSLKHLKTLVWMAHYVSTSEGGAERLSPLIIEPPPGPGTLSRGDFRTLLRAKRHTPHTPPAIENTRLTWTNVALNTRVRIRVRIPLEYKGTF